MWSHLKDAVKCQLLVNKVEEVTPVPSKILDNAVCVKLDPQVEGDERNASCPSRNESDSSLSLRPTAAGDSKQAVRNKITHEYEIHDPAEYKPRVVFKWCLLKFVVLGYLCLKFTLNEFVQSWMRVITSAGVYEDLRLLCPSCQFLVMRLDLEEVANPNIVAGAPAQEDDTEDRYSDV